MWFIILFAACTTAIPIAFEIHYKGSDNILTKSGQELRRLPFVTGPLEFLATLQSATFAVLILVFWAFAILGGLGLISWLAKWLS